VGLPERPRLCVFRSQKHLYAQLVDDFTGKTLHGWSTQDELLRKALKKGATREAATALGERVAQDLTKRGTTQVVFDRGGYVYHGRVKALADAVRAGGIHI
jgi:large subunit ribosomal protein L18